MKNQELIPLLYDVVFHPFEMHFGKRFLPQNLYCEIIKEYYFA